MQACHGKSAPLRRVRPGDGVVYYSPTKTVDGKVRMQAFTAFGIVREGEPHVVDMGAGFRPWRRAVDWQPARDAPIRPMLQALSFTAGRTNWGACFRFGLLPVSESDFYVIAAEMGVSVLQFRFAV